MKLGIAHDPVLNKSPRFILRSSIVYRSVFFSATRFPCLGVDHGYVVFSIKYLSKNK